MSEAYARQRLAESMRSLEQRELPVPLQQVFEKYRGFFFRLAGKHKPVPMELLYEACFYFSRDNNHRYDPQRGTLDTFTTNGWKKAMSKAHVNWMRKLGWSRLHQVADRDTENEFWNRIPARETTPLENVITAEEAAFARALHKKRIQVVRLALEQLPSRERDIIRMRFGLPPYERSYTLIEIAPKYKVTRERIRQIQNKGITRLQFLLGIPIPAIPRSRRKKT